MRSPTPQGCQHTVLPDFPKTCIKLKEFGPRGVHASKILLCRSATVNNVNVIIGDYNEVVVLYENVLIKHLTLMHASKEILTEILAVFRI